MAKEDFTTYTEVDPNSRITKTADRVTYTNLSRKEDAYVYKDMGVDHFNGDFEHLIEVQINSGDNTSWALVWGLANLIDDWRGIKDAGGDSLDIIFSVSDAGVPRIQILELDGGTPYYFNWECSFNTTYYLKIKRDEAVGPYGTLYCYIYSDPARANLLTTLTLELHSSKKDFRYIYVCNTYNDGWAPAQSGFSQNLDLQEVVVKPRSHGYIF